MSGGEREQETKGFPISGDLQMETEAENIRAYLPSSGRYLFGINLNDH